MSASLISTLTFLSVTLCIVGVAQLVYDLFFRHRARIDQRLRDELGEALSERAKAAPLFKDLQAAQRDVPLGVPTWSVRLQTLVDQAGQPWTRKLLATLTLLAPVVVGGVVWAIARGWLLPLVAAAVAVPLPLVAVFVARQRRRDLLCRQLPDAFDVMSRALRAGQTVSSSFQLIGQDFPQPIAEEFTYCYEQQHLGISQEVALRDLARRTNIMELQMFVVAMIVQARTGGNLAELLAKLAAILRKRANIQNRVKALTGEGRMQAAVLIALPFAIFIALYVLNREYAQILLDRPLLLLGCCASQAIGAVCIHKMIQIDF